MLYQSLKQTIIEYDQRKKQTQSEGDKHLFKWKVLALGSCILVIVLLGILSQLIQSHKDDQSEIHNMTFIPQLLLQSNELESIASIKNLVAGLNRSPRIIFDSSEKLLGTNSTNPRGLLAKINEKSNILFIFNLSQNEEQTQINYRFGMLLKRYYDSKIDPIDNIISIYDSTQDLSSVMFNLNQSKSMRMNLDAGCKLYSYSQNNNDLTILESIHIKGGQGEVETMLVQLQITRQSCFGEGQAQALKRMAELTGIKLQTIKDRKTLKINSIQLFYLNFNGRNVE